MITLKLEEKELIGLLSVGMQNKIDAFSNKDILCQLKIGHIAEIYESYLEEDQDLDKNEAILFLQTMAYQRHRVHETEKLTEFIFDKIFEYYSIDP